MTGEIPALAEEALRSLQLDRLRETLRRACRHVPHYRRAFDEAGVGPDDLRSLSDLARYPFPSVPLDGRDALAAELRRHVRESVGLTVGVEVVEPHALERSLGKAKRISDRRR